MTSFMIEQEHLDYLSTRDAVFGQLIGHIPPVNRKRDTHFFQALVSNIVYQQISTAAGNAIWKRLTHAVDPMTPQQLEEASHEKLRSCGLSNSKATYVKAIAQAYSSGFLTDNFFLTSTPETIISRLTTIKGIGTWTAEMFLMFSLGHLDTFSYGDLGLRNGIQWLYSLDEPPSVSLVKQLVRRWSPYATLAALYLWEITTHGLLKTDRQSILGPLPYDLKKEGASYIDTPLGPLAFYGSREGLTAIEFNQIPTFINETPLMLWAKEELTAYFQGSLKTFTVPYILTGTPFQQGIYKKLVQVPYGQTINYGQLASAIGNPKASRAVGGANNKNKLPIIIPCHRVVGSKGQLVGYAGGLPIKSWLLEHEHTH